MENFNDLQNYINADKAERKEIKSKVISKSMQQYCVKNPHLNEDKNLHGFYMLKIDDIEMCSSRPSELLRVVKNKGYSSLHVGTLDTLLPIDYIDHLQDDDYPAFIESVDRIMKVCS